jgi:hypothetical protein
VKVGTVLGSGTETVTFEGTASNSVVSTGGSLVVLSHGLGTAAPAVRWGCKDRDSVVGL